MYLTKKTLRTFLPPTDLSRQSLAATLNLVTRSSHMEMKVMFG